MPEFEDAAKILEIQARSILLNSSRLGVSFDSLVSRSLDVLRGGGRLVLSGLGKSGYVARKISSTLSSTGSSSFFLHPAEAAHGDLGMLRSCDAVLFVSFSGSSEEICEILPNIKSIVKGIYSFTGDLNSPLARSSDVVVEIFIEEECCPLGLAPMSSTTVSMAIGDALACVLMKINGFKVEDFALFHPGGRLGKRLSLRVKDLLRSSFPTVRSDTSLRESLVVMSSGGCGLVIVTDDKLEVLGIFTDGDLRRCLEKRRSDILDVCISDLMTLNPKVVSVDELAFNAMQIMERNKILHLIAMDGKRVCGVVSLYDLVQVGL